MNAQRGFTLVEVMIVVVIVAILSAIGIPSYQDYVRRGKITEAISAMSDMRVKMEQFFQDNRTYLADATTSPATNDCTAADTTTSQYFDFSCVAAPTAAGYTLQAVGKATGTMTGFTYTIDQSGTRTSGFSAALIAKGWAVPVPNTCWATKKGGVC